MEEIKNETQIPEISPVRIEKQCLREIHEVLKKYNCGLAVQFTQSMVLDQPVLTYAVEVKFNNV